MAFGPIEMILTWVIFGAYLVFLAVAGFYSKRKTKTLSDFMVAGRSIGPVLLGISFGVTYFSAVMVIGGGEYSWNWGLATLWIAGLNTLAGVCGAFIFFGKRTRALGVELDCMTVPQLLGRRYQEKKVQTLTAVIQLVFQTIYVVSIYMGLATLLSVIIPTAFVEVTFIIATSIVGVITIIYLNVGGSHGAIFTDAAESIIVLVGIVVIFAAGIVAIGGFQGLVDGLASLENVWGELRSFPGRAGTPSVIPSGGMLVIGMVSVTSFGVWGMPQMISRFYTAKEGKTLRWGLVISASWAFVVAFFAWFNGAISRVFFNVTYPSLEPNVGAATSIPYLMIHTLPLFAGVIMAAVTAASLTTGEKIILMAASSFSIDVYQEKTGASDDDTLRVTRIVSTLVVIIGVVGAIFSLILELAAILALCMFAWAAMCSTILIPYGLGLYWKKGTGRAAFWSGIIAITFAIIQYVFFYAGGNGLWMGNYPAALKTFAWNPIITLDIIGIPNDIVLAPATIHPFFVGVPISFILFIVFSLLDKEGAPPEEFLEKTFIAMKEEETII